MEGKKFTTIGQNGHRQFNNQNGPNQNGLNQNGFIRPKKVFTNEQRTNFLNTQEIVCTAIAKKPIKFLFNPKEVNPLYYFTDITVIGLNKQLNKMGHFPLNNRNFEKFNIINENGRGHNVKSFLTQMWVAGFIIFDIVKDQIHIKVHDEWMEIIKDKKKNIQNNATKKTYIDEHKGPIPIEDSSSSEEEEDDEIDKEA